VEAIAAYRATLGADDQTEFGVILADETDRIIVNQPPGQTAWR